MQTKRNEGSADYERKIKKLRKRIRRLSWFPSYQTFTEIGIKGKRNDSVRYRYVNFKECSNKVIVDFGCNLGQTCVKAYKAGAKRVIGLDSQKDTIKMAREISALLKTDIEYYSIDFNGTDYQRYILDILGNDKIDISFFLSVYRTKELKNREGLFQFIIDMTKEKIFFEGHAAPQIDTNEYYSNIFRKFPVRYSFQGYTEERARPFYVVIPKK